MFHKKNSLLRTL